MVPSVYNLQDKQNGRILRTMTYKHSWLDVLLQLLHDLVIQHFDATRTSVPTYCCTIWTNDYNFHIRVMFCCIDAYKRVCFHNEQHHVFDIVSAGYQAYKHSRSDVLPCSHDLLTQHIEATTAPVSVPGMNGTGFINVQLVRPEITAMAFIGYNCRSMRTVICLDRQHKHRNVTLFCPLVMDYEHSGFDDLPGTLSH